MPGPSLQSAKKYRLTMCLSVIFGAYSLVFIIHHFPAASALSIPDISHRNFFMPPARAAVILAYVDAREPCGATEKNLYFLTNDGASIVQTDWRLANAQYRNIQLPDSIRDRIRHVYIDADSAVVVTNDPVSFYTGKLNDSLSPIACPLPQMINLHAASINIHESIDRGMLFVNDLFTENELPQQDKADLHIVDVYSLRNKCYLTSFLLNGYRHQPMRAFLVHNSDVVAVYSDAVVVYHPDGLVKVNTDMR